MYDLSRNLQYIEFNKNDKPWRLFATSILHDNSLVSDPRFNSVDNNNLVIESRSSDIRFFVNDDKKIEFNGYSVFNNNVSFLNNVSFKDISCNNLTVNQDISINGNLYFNHVSVQHMKEKLESIEASYNDLLILANQLGITI
jgi:hypothetical protein|tara:strand:- start:1306 stop:1731 length:426 start_codon:yes stop_codon:yes gene_type:complete